ncbi:hypothetical protein Tco_0243252 [Tanacetum coccineum]
MYTFSPMMVANSRKHHCRVRSYTREVLVISTNLDIQKNHYPLDFRNRRGDEARIKNTWYNQGYCRDHMLKSSSAREEYFLPSPSEWDTHVVVWMNKPDFETMGLDDLYNNFKIVEQKVKRTVAANNDDKNLAFLTTSSPSSTNTINTVNTGVSTGNTKVNTASTETSTASFSDATVYAFLFHSNT